jgi:hypothetical protein
MREVCVGVLVVCLAVAETDGQPDEATQAIVTDARNALGGGAALDAVRALRLIGRSARTVGPLRLSADVTIEVAFPSRYRRVDRISLGGRSSEISTGFSGDRLIQGATGADGARIEPLTTLPSDLSGRGLLAAVTARRQEAGLLLLGFFCSGPEGFTTEFARAGRAESRDGAADVLELHVAGLEGRLFVDARTRLPLMVSWMAPDALSAALADGGGQRPASPPSLETLLARAQAIVEHRLYFGDHRVVGGLTWPFRIRRSVGGETTEELTFERLIPNPTIDARAFEPEP